MVRALFLCLFLAGCAALTESECRVGDWYALGEQDALRGAQPRVEQFIEQCRAYQVQPSEPDYMAGWRIGYSEWNRRTSRM